MCALFATRFKILNFLSQDQELILVGFPASTELKNISIQSFRFIIPFLKAFCHTWF